VGLDARRRELLQVVAAAVSLTWSRVSRGVEPVSRADQQIAGVLLPTTHQSPAGPQAALEPAAEAIFYLLSVSWRGLARSQDVAGMALAIQLTEQMLKLESNSTSLHFLENFKC
jgi:hypothetical protein